MDEKSSAAAAPRAVGSSRSATNAQSATPSKEPGGRPFAFPKSKRLLKRADYKRVYEHGSRVTGPYFSMFFLRRDDASANAAVHGARTGFTTPRAVGKAVVRNRIRRRVREAVRLEIGRLAAPVDIVFNPRRSVLDATWDALQREVRRALAKCGS